MKIISFGSLNVDHVYQMPRFVQPGETLSAAALSLHAGGKGLNQSVAASRAGAEVIHGGAVGPDGDSLLEMLRSSGACADHVLRLDAPTGHAVIQVNPQGQNAIIVYGGANHGLTKEYIYGMLSLAQPGDLVLLQNETNAVADIIRLSAEKGLCVVFNPSPLPANPDALPLHQVGILMVNEIEGACLAGLGEDAPSEEVLKALREKYPGCTVVLTLGSRGVMCAKDGQVYRHGIFQVDAVDTTAAGDTFCGYFLAGCCRGLPIPQCLKMACAASAIAVSRPGAAPSIPDLAEVDNFLANQKEI